MGTFPGSMCHSARLAQHNLPAGQKKTTKGLNNEKENEASYRDDYA